MRFILLLIYLPLLTAPVFAQTTFHKKWAGSLIFDACPLETGGVLLAGYNSPRNSLAVRLDDAGAIIWSKSYAPMHDICNVLEVPDGYIIAGDSLVPDGPNDNARYTIIAKLSPTGEVIWSQALGGFNLDIRSKQLTATSSGFIFSGTQQLVSFPSRIEPLIIRFDHDGDVQWSKTYTTEFNTFNGELYAQHVEGDTLFACGDIHGNACFIRLNYHSGELMEWRTFGGPFVENLSSMFQLNDGNYLMAGSTRSTTFSEADRCWIVNTDRHGQMRWSKVFNISGMNQRAWLTKSNDGNFVFSAGRGYNNGSSSIPILCKISPEGQPIWAYDYSGGTPFSLNQLSSTADGGLLAVNYNTLLKTDAEGRVLNGCCPAPVSFEVNDYFPPYQNYLLEAGDWNHFQPVTISGRPDTLFNYRDFCDVEVTSLTYQMEVCQGDSVAINGVYYQAPLTIRDTVYSMTGGCDTVVVYNLLSVPLPFRLQPLGFCPGTSVVLNGVTYTEPTYVTEYLPAAAGCDTQLVYNLYWTQLPRRFETTYFCPGDSVVVDGIPYFYPTGFPPDTLQGMGNDCDTLLFHFLSYHNEASTVNVQCPPNLLVGTDPGVLAPVAYDLPGGSSTCTCPDIHLTLDQGLPPGALFPVGNTQVCYTVGDVCGAATSCCFNVFVEERAPCDLKQTPCLKFELLGIFINSEQHRRYRLRVTNNCSSPVAYLAFEIPDGLEALSPPSNSVFSSESGREYGVRHPNMMPFRSLRFKSIGVGIAGGQSDIFDFTLPAQADAAFFKAHARLSAGLAEETVMNTFNCEKPESEDREEQAKQTNCLSVYPNPAQNEISLRFSSPRAVNGQLDLMDTRGCLIAMFPVSSEQSEQTIPLPERLNNGVYFLEFTDETGVKQRVKLLLFR